jgi:hypothetical protein
MGRKPRALPVGQLEYLERPFDRALDVEAFAAERFHDLKTGQWGIRRYRTTPGCNRPLFVVLRASDDILLKGKRVPFANQLEDIARTVATRANGRGVVAIFWDCESGSDFRGIGVRKRAIGRAAFEASHAEAASAERPCAELWVWRSDRLARGWRYLPQLMELQARRVSLMAATGRIRRDFLPLEIMMAQRERDNWRRRAMVGKRSLAERHALPPTRRIPVGWRAHWRHQPPVDRTDYEIVHDPEAMPAWETALTGLRFEGWTWERATDHLNHQGVKRLADRDQQTDARALAWNPRIVRKSLANHGWWVGRGRWTDTPMDVDEDGEEVEAAPVRLGFSVPPARVDDPATGRRPLTQDDLTAIWAAAGRGPGGGWVKEGRGKRPLSERAVCGLCERTLRHQLVRSGAGDYYLLRCDSPSQAQEQGRERCGRRPVMIREAVALEQVWEAVAAALLDPATATAEARRRLAEVEATPVLEQALGLRRRARELTEAEGRLLAQRALDPGNEAGYAGALEHLRRERRGIEDVLAEAAQRAADAQAERDGLAQTVDAYAVYEAALGEGDGQARAILEAAVALAGPGERGEMIRGLVREARVDGAGAWRVTVGLAGAGGVLGRLVPDGFSSRALSTWYKTAPTLTLRVA